VTKRVLAVLLSERPVSGSWKMTETTAGQMPAVATNRMVEEAALKEYQ